jgi:hypothetical protein
MDNEDVTYEYDTNINWYDNCDSSNTVTISMDDLSLGDLCIDTDALENWTTGSDLTGNLTFHSAEYTQNRNMLDNIFAPSSTHKPYGTNGKTFEYINQTGIYNSHDTGLYILERLARNSRRK